MAKDVFYRAGAQFPPLGGAPPHTGRACAVARDALHARVITRVQIWWRQAGWDEFVRVLGGVVFLGAVLLFVTLAVSAPKGTFLEAELHLMRAFRDEGRPLGPHWALEAVRDLTALGSATVLILLILLILGDLCLRRHYRIALLIALTTGGGEILNAILKDAFDRARPDATLRLVEVSTSSFPSGHSMAGSIFYLTIGAVLARVATRRREKSYFMLTAILLTGLTGFSRVYLGVHYPTDVLAGWSAGAAWALLCWYIADALARRGKMRAETGEVAST